MIPLTPNSLQLSPSGSLKTQNKSQQPQLLPPRSFVVGAGSRRVAAEYICQLLPPLQDTDVHSS